jgi:hypothetical protein
MPRPLNYTSGEGRYKGLGQVDPNTTDLSLFGGWGGMPLNQNSETLSFPWLSNPTQIGTTSQIAMPGGGFVNTNYSNPNPVVPPSITQWISQNQTMLLIGIVAGLILMRK